MAKPEIMAKVALVREHHAPVGALRPAQTRSVMIVAESGSTTHL